MIKCRSAWERCVREQSGFIWDIQLQSTAAQSTASGSPPSLHFCQVFIYLDNSIGLLSFSRCHLFVHYNYPTASTSHLSPSHNTHASSKLKERSVSHLLCPHLLYRMNRAVPDTPTVSCRKPSQDLHRSPNGFQQEGWHCECS